MLENLRVIKAKHTALCSQLKEIAAAQKESMDSIRDNFIIVMGLIQHFQQTTDVEVHTNSMLTVQTPPCAHIVEIVGVMFHIVKLL